MFYVESSESVKTFEINVSNPSLSPANEVREGYVFTDVCLSTGGEPQGQTSPGQTPPGRHQPLPSTPSSASGDTHPLPSACWDTVNKRSVRIPLECILVLYNIPLNKLTEKYIKPESC